MKNLEMPTILDVEKGVIMCQVNCVNRNLDKGLVGAIIGKYPEVLHTYQGLYNNNLSETLLGTTAEVNPTKELTIVMSFSQYFSGNGKEDGKIYTNVDHLLENIKSTCKKFANQEVYIPEGMGCYHANANWQDVQSDLEKANLDNLIVIHPTKPVDDDYKNWMNK